MNNLFSTLSKAAGAAAILFASVMPGFADWKEGDTVPDLSGFELSGEIPALKGKVTYIDFWASWCPPCKAAFPAIEELYQDLKDENFQVIAVSLDSSKASMERFLARANPSFVVSHDVTQKLAQDTGLEVMPTSYLVDGDGKIRSVHTGWRGRESALELRSEVKALLQELSE